MAYPPGNYGYPPNPPQPSVGIGFDNMYQQPNMSPYPAQPAAPYGQAAPAPYPVGQPTAYPMPGADPMAPPGGMPNAYNPGFYGQPQANTSFQAAAYATTAFRPPVQQPAYGMPPSPYPAPAQPSTYPAASPGYPSQPSTYPAASSGWGSQPCNQTASNPYPTASQNGSRLVRHHTLPPQHVRTSGSVVPFAPFNAQQDADVLRKAMKGFGCDEKAVSHILATRSNEQRQKIKLEYKTTFGRDLLKDIRSELSGNSEDVALALLTVPGEYDAHLLRKAMKGLGTDEEVLIEVLCTRTNKQIKEASEAFKKLYSRDLEKDVHSETSGHFRRLLVSLCQGYRDETQVVDLVKARDDANKLYQAGEARWGTDESQFNSILVQRSYPQLRAMFDEYSKICKYSIEASIERELSGDLKKGMSTIVKCVKNTPAFFAEQLHQSMKGLGTDDDKLIRIIVSRSEIDMVEIKAEFKKMYGKTLGRFVTDDTSGNYKRILLEIIGGSN